MTSNQTDGNDKQAQRVTSYRGLFDLHGKVAVVTGGVGILGQHFCAGLAESGADVAVVDLQVEKAQGSAQILAERYGHRWAALREVSGKVQQCSRFFN